jgi:hypothetical protein
LLTTGVLHVFYTESLQRAYRAGDLSMVYPVARGTAPGLIIAGYTLTDAYSVKVLALSPGLVEYSGNCFEH